MEGFEYQLFQSGQLALTTAGDKFTFIPGTPVEVIRWGIIADALIDVGAGMVVKADKVDSAGTRGDGNMGTLSTGTTDVPAQDGIYTENVSPLVTAHPTQPHKLIPGERMVIEVTDAADTAGTGYFFVEYKKRPFQDGTITAASKDLRNLVKLTS